MAKSGAIFSSATTLTQKREVDENDKEDVEADNTKSESNLNDDSL